MKKLAFTCLCLFGLVGATQAQSTFSLDIDAGYLRNTSATGAVVTSGALLQLIASPSGTFTNPTATSFLSGDEALISSFAFSTVMGNPGETVNPLNSLLFTTTNYTVTSGEKLELRFYPTLTCDSSSTNYNTTGPGTSKSFGGVRSDTVEFSTAVDPTETTWIVPAAGSTVDLDYITSDNGGTAAFTPASAAATGITPVPEPSTYAGGLLGCALIAYVSRRRMRSRHQA